MTDWLDEIKARRAVIDKTPWDVEVVESCIVIPHDHYDLHGPEGTVFCVASAYEDSQPNITFIRNAPTDIDHLITEIDRLRPLLSACRTLSKDAEAAYVEGYEEMIAVLATYDGEFQTPPVFMDRGGAMAK